MSLFLYFGSLIILWFTIGYNSGPDFNKNDIICIKNLESWEQRIEYKVVEVGKQRYLLSPTFGNGYIPAIDQTMELCK